MDRLKNKMVGRSPLHCAGSNDGPEPLVGLPALGASCALGHIAIDDNEAYGLLSHIVGRLVACLSG